MYGLRYAQFLFFVFFSLLLFLFFYFSWRRRLQNVNLMKWRDFLINNNFVTMYVIQCPIEGTLITFIVSGCTCFAFFWNLFVVCRWPVVTGKSNWMAKIINFGEISHVFMPKSHPCNDITHHFFRWLPYSSTINIKIAFK